MTTAAPLHTPAACGLAPPEAFAWPVRRPLLSAEWRNLVLLNFDIDPRILEPYTPAGTELDYFDGRTFVSIVGFQFLDVRLFGLRIPYHANFEEVNLRFYVRRRAEEGWRRGVVFIRELAPRWAVSATARWLYGENYLCVPMSHLITSDENGGAAPPTRVEYRWRFRNQNHHIALDVADDAHLPTPGSHEDFFIENYWGYTARPRNRASEYLVAHPPWQIASAAKADLDCDARRPLRPAVRPNPEPTPDKRLLGRWLPGPRLPRQSLGLMRLAQ